MPVPEIISRHSAAVSRADLDIDPQGRAPVARRPSGRLILDIAIVVAISLAIRLAWMFMVPISQAPDEGAHYWVLHFISTNLHLPGLADVQALPTAAYYAPLATISYIPHLAIGPLFAALFGLEPALAFRLGSVAMSTLAVVGAYLVSREIFSSSRFLSLAVPLVIALHPQFAFIGSYSNNDATCAAVATFLFYQCVLLVKYGLSRSSATYFGLLLGLLLAGKPTGYCLLPVAVLSVLFALKFHRESTDEILRRSVRAVILAILVASPFFLKNILLFDGDMLGARTMQTAWEQAYGHVGAWYKLPVVDNADWRYFVFVSYWGTFGNMDRLLSGRTYKWLSWLICLSGAGFGLRLAWMYCKHGLDSLRERKVELAIFCIAFSCVAVNLMEIVYASASFNSAGPPQGRYLFPSETPLACLAVGGLALLGGRRFLYLPVVALLAFCVFSAVQSFAMLYPDYGFSLTVFR